MLMAPEGVLMSCSMAAQHKACAVKQVRERDLGSPQAFEGEFDQLLRSRTPCEGIELEREPRALLVGLVTRL